MDQLKRMGDFTCDLVKISIFAMKYHDPKQLGEENVYWLTLPQSCLSANKFKIKTHTGQDPKDRS